MSTYIELSLDQKTLTLQLSSQEANYLLLAMIALSSQNLSPQSKWATATHKEIIKFIREMKRE